MVQNMLSINLKIFNKKPTTPTPSISCKEILKIIEGDDSKEEDVSEIAFSIGRKVSSAISRNAFHQQHFYNSDIFLQEFKLAGISHLYT